MKKIVSVLLLLAMVISIPFSSFAAEEKKDTYEIQQITKDEYINVLMTQFTMNRQAAIKQYEEQYKIAINEVIKKESNKKGKMMAMTASNLTPMTISAVDYVGARCSVEFGVLGFCARPSGSFGYIASIDENTVYALENAPTGNYVYKKGYIKATNNQSYVNFRARGQFEVAISQSLQGTVGVELLNATFQVAYTEGMTCYYRKNITTDINAYVR